MQIVADRMLTEGSSYGSGPPLAKSACIAIKNLWADLDMAG
jgi:hypothetical protein